MVISVGAADRQVQLAPALVREPNLIACKERFPQHLPRGINFPFENLDVIACARELIICRGSCLVRFLRSRGEPAWLPRGGCSQESRHSTFYDSAGSSCVLVSGEENKFAATLHGCLVRLTVYNWWFRVAALDRSELERCNSRQ